MWILDEKVVDFDGFGGFLAFFVEKLQLFCLF